MKKFLSYAQADVLLELLRAQGYECLGPRVEEGVIKYLRMDDMSQLPWGMQDVQTPGSYRLKKSEINRAFAWANGPQAIKPLVFKPRELLWRVKRDEHGKLIFEQKPPAAKRLALFGVKACDIAALLIQDKVFLEGEYEDRRYKEQRQKLLLIVVNCSHASQNCFCVTMDTGPKARQGYDLSLTEVDGGFVIEDCLPGIEPLLHQLALMDCSERQLDQARQAIEHAAKGQTKSIPNHSGMQETMLASRQHPRWDDVASRCLSCGNCTSSCPTCFCHNEMDKPELSGEESSHIREWDSCFTQDHSYIHGKVIRQSTKLRYQQWLTHKVGTWWQQFGTSGCVGCGRCMTWCPVGIDMTEEVNALCQEPQDD